MDVRVKAENTESGFALLDSVEETIGKLEKAGSLLYTDEGSGCGMLNALVSNTASAWH